MAKIKIEGLTPYSQSRHHDEPFLDGELPDAYDLRTWRSHMHVRTINGKETVIIPAVALTQCLVSAAQYSGEKIKGQGQKTWTAKIASGVALFDDIDLKIDPATVQPIPIYAHVSGRRGPGPRVTRRFPNIPVWGATFEIGILDPIVTQEVLEETLRVAGLFIGIGRYAPFVSKGGTCGRFVSEVRSFGEKRGFANKAA
jgi:hypothetical protein